MRPPSALHGGPRAGEPAAPPADAGRETAGPARRPPAGDAGADPDGGVGAVGEPAARERSAGAAAAGSAGTAAPPALRYRRVLGFGVLLAVAAAAFLAAVAVGAAGLPLRSVLAALAGGGDETARTIVLHLRLPRAALAALVGAGLALSGAVFQALLRNPLAEPYVLGVSGGAAVGAVGAVALGWAAAAPWAVPGAAFAGAVGAILLVLHIATRVAGGIDTRVLLLAGVIVGAFFNALILVLLALADLETFRSAVFWLMGSMAGATWTAAAVLAAYLVPAGLALLALARPLNLLALGEDVAHHLGARVGAVKLAAFGIASLLVAAAVAVSGIIGFIGLIVPHAVRLVGGPDNRWVLPASALAGAAFLLAADTLARTATAPGELPVGVVTALVGVPVFLLLLTRRRL